MQRLTQVNPTRASDRLLTFDVLRGLSLFGILLVNMAFYTLPMFYYPPGFPHWSRPVDQHLDTIIVQLGETEFLSIFSFLFGLGFAFQLKRVKGDPQSDRLFLLRVAVLFALGLFHAFFIWMGDVLVWYAVIAVALLLLRHAKASALLVVATITIAVRIVRLEWLVLYPLSSADIERHNSYALAQVRECLQVYAHGSFQEIFSQRAKDVWFQYSHPIDLSLHIFFVFLIGFYVGRLGLFEQGSENLRKCFVRVWRFGIVFGLGGHMLRYALPRFHLNALPYIDPPLVIVSDFAMAALYVATVVLAMTNPKFAKLLSPFASIGRTTLTNYICQSLIVTTLAYSYGLGLYGKLTPVDWLTLTLVIYVLQLWISVLWLRRFAYGPVEWLSRLLIYGKRIPMKLSRNNLRAAKG